MSRLTSTKETLCDSTILLAFAASVMHNYVLWKVESYGTKVTSARSANFMQKSCCMRVSSASSTRRTLALRQCFSRVNHLRVVYFTLLYYIHIVVHTRGPIQLKIYILNIYIHLKILIHSKIYIYTLKYLYTF
jgi:hypothetical protein